MVQVTVGKPRVNRLIFKDCWEWRTGDEERKKKTIDINKHCHPNIPPQITGVPHSQTRSLNRRQYVQGNQHFQLLCFLLPVDTKWNLCEQQANYPHVLLCYSQTHLTWAENNLLNSVNCLSTYQPSPFISHVCLLSNNGISLKCMITYMHMHKQRGKGGQTTHCDSLTIPLIISAENG